MKSLHYLAAPYTHHLAHVEAQRFELINLAAAHLFEHGILVFSPISHCHPIKMVSKLDGTFETWRAFNECMIFACNGFIILTLEGWKVSKGVIAELAFARSINLDVQYMNPFTSVLTDTPSL